MMVKFLHATAAKRSNATLACMHAKYSICVYFSSGALRVMSQRERQGPNVQMTDGLTKSTALLKVFVLGHLQHAFHGP